MPEIELVVARDHAPQCIIEPSVSRRADPERGRSRGGGPQQFGEVARRKGPSPSLHVEDIVPPLSGTPSCQRRAMWLGLPRAGVLPPQGGTANPEWLVVRRG